MSPPLFEVDNLHVAVDGVEILKGVDLVVGAGEVHAPDGARTGPASRRSPTPCSGNPAYQVTAGRVLFKGEDVTEWPPDVRGKAGMFLAFQYPEEIPGVPVAQFLRQALSARRGMDLSVLELPRLDHGVDEAAGDGPLLRGPLSE